MSASYDDIPEDYTGPLPRKTIRVANDVVTVEVAGFEVPLDSDTAHRIQWAMAKGEWDEVGKILAGVGRDGDIPDHETLRRKAKVAAEMVKLKREMEELDAVPAEPRPEDSPTGAVVLTFTKNFGGNTSYTYAALKVNGLWCITGRNNRDRNFTWLDLWKFINRGESKTPAVWVANGFTEL